jgi:DNA topoisomerase-2
MVLFDQRGVIKRYETAEDILKEFYELRIDYYGKRRLCLIKVPTSPSCLCLTVASH